MSQTPFIITTRRSPLALWQAHHVKARIEARCPELTVTLKEVVTQGDKILDVSLSKIGGKGLFLKELEHCLLNQEAHIAVHSLKDVPAELPEGLSLPIICERDEPRDAWVCPKGGDWMSLPAGAVVGTSSLRRASQLLSLRPDIEIKMLRGNVGTRLSKLDAGEYDAIILAGVGLKRLGLSDRITQHFPESILLPAVGQGVLGIECRTGDQFTLEILERAGLHHLETAQCVGAERRMNAVLNGGCQVPIGGHATLTEGNLTLRGMVAAPDGSELLMATCDGPADDYRAIGERVAASLLQQGAEKYLQPHD